MGTCTNENFNLIFFFIIFWQFDLCRVAEGGIFLVILDLKIGFYTQKYPLGQVLRSVQLNFTSNMSNTCFSLTEAPPIYGSHGGQRGGSQKTHTKRERRFTPSSGDRKGPFEKSSGFTIKVKI